jgi:hypothetical protein
MGGWRRRKGYWRNLVWRSSRKRSARRDERGVVPSDERKQREDGQCTCEGGGMRLKVRFYLFVVSRLVKLRTVIHDRG